jgi:hypothetical protein
MGRGLQLSVDSDAQRGNAPIVAEIGSASVPNEELGMRGEHAVGEKLAELRLRPPVHNAVNDAMEIRSRVDVVRDARRDDR